MHIEDKNNNDSDSLLATSMVGVNLTRIILTIGLILIMVSIACDLAGQTRVPRLLSDGAVLQRNTELNIWGWDTPGMSISVSFNGTAYSGKAGLDGKWSIRVSPHPAGGPYDMQISGSDDITVKDILIGDVWVCSGQSNMEYMMERSRERYPDIIANSTNSQIRQFTVPDQYDFNKTHEDLNGGQWESANPENTINFSAVAYFFARELYRQYQIPIGIINAAHGGARVNCYISEDSLRKFPKAYAELQRFKDQDLIDSIEQDDKQRIDGWGREANRKDIGRSSVPNWHSPDLDDSDWQEMDITGYWADGPLGKTNGVVWFRKEIILPDSWAGKQAKLWLGRIIDSDSAYINGQFTGTISYQYPPRRYDVKPGVLKAGRNILSVRVVNESGTGGFAIDKPYYLALPGDTIDLRGKWKYKLSTTMPPLRVQTFIRWKPTGLYNKMLAPLTHYNIKGVIWYQGEANMHHPEGYVEEFSTMIRNWRTAWGIDDLPFLYVQLPNFGDILDHPAESSLAGLRQEQLNTLSIPNTGMVVAIDVGEWNDLHPTNKKSVGERLALLARERVYGESIHGTSPVPRKAVFGKRSVEITFDHIGDGLVSRDGKPLRYFELSSDGRAFHWAKARIVGSTVVISKRGIKDPVAVRYAWADSPEEVNFYSEIGLPVSPFEVIKYAKTNDHRKP